MLSLAALLRRFSTLAAGGSLESQVAIFDGALKALQRDRAAAAALRPDPLLDEVSERLVERLEDCTRKFPHALVLGGAGAQVAARLAGGRAGVMEVEYMDTSPHMLERARAYWQASGSGSQWPKMEFTQCDPTTELLPVQEKTYDVVISCLGLHWANDVPGVMAQCQRALKPDGLFVAAMLGGSTLQELRIACTIAQQEREGGVSPRVSPLAQVRDAGNLLTRAGLAIPTVDVDDVQVNYRDPVDLVQHLRAMGESNALLRRRPGLRRDTALAAAAAYASLFGEGEGEGEERGVPATFQVIFMTGWAPDPSQRKAAKRGSATVSFEDIADAFGDGGGEPAGEPGGARHAGGGPPGCGSPQ